MISSALRNLTLTLFLSLSSVFSYGQCELFDGNGVPSLNPVWLSCFGGDYTLVVQSPNNLGAWTIDWGDGSPTENGTDLIPPASINHVYTATINSYTVTFTETSTGCTVTGTVVMEEPSNASIQIPFGGVTQSCAPATLGFLNSSTDVSGTTVFSWDFGDGSPIETYDGTNAGQIVSHTYLKGTVNCETVVTLTAENQCNVSQGSPSTATFNPIRIWDLDEANIGVSASVLCYPDTTLVFSNTTDRNCLNQGNTFQRQELWNFGDYWGLGYDSIVDWTPWPPTFPRTIDYPGIGTYEVMLVDSNFCGLDTAFMTVNITPPPTANFSVSKDTLCVDEQMTTVNLSGGGANAWVWNFGDGSGDQGTGAGNQTHSYVAPGDYTISLIANISGATAACTDTFTLEVHVLPSPNANIIVNNNNACDSMTVTFTDASIDAVSWDWTFGNGNTSTLQNPVNQFYSSPNTYNVSLAVASANGCPNTENVTLNVWESPVVNFVPASVCQNSIANFSDQSTSSLGDPIISWDWDFGDGNNSTLQNPTNTYGAVGSFDISLEVSTAHCSARDTITIDVESTPTASFTQNFPDGCTDLDVSFTNTSTGAVNYFWDFGDGSTSTDQDPTHTFTNSGSTDVTFDVMMIASTTFGCADTAYQTITVYPGTAASFTHNGLPGCAPLPVNFTNTSDPSATFTWDFGDGNGSTAIHPSHTYINATLFIDNYTVTLVATSLNGCIDSAQQVVSVYPLPDFGFASVPDSGCSPLQVDFPSVIGAVQYDWDFGDGSNGSGPTPTHIYTNTTTNDVVYDITLIAVSPFGCVDTTGGTVKVFPNPTAQFTLNATAGCSPFPIEFENTSIGATTVHWDYGDLTSSDTLDAIHTYTYTNFSENASTHTVELTVTTDRGCTDQTIRIVEVYPKVTATFVSEDQGCSPLTICTNNMSSNASSYTWDFGDGNISLVPNPCHIYVNNGLVNTNHNLELVATSVYGCTDTTRSVITVFPKPTAQFTVDAANGCHPHNVQVDNLSIGAQIMAWDYGDFNTSNTLANTHSHTYVNNGNNPLNHTLELIASNLQGCSDTVAQAIEVYPPVTASFLSDTAGCSPVSICMSNTSTNASSYLWNFGDGVLGTQTNPCHVYVNNSGQDTTFNLTMVATSVFGCTDTTTDQIFVYPIPNADFVATPSQQTYPDVTVNYINNSSVGAWDYSWEFGDGTQSTVFAPSAHDYPSWGTYTINLSVSSPFCFDTTSRTITIDPPQPIVQFYGQGQGCRPVTVQFVDSSVYVTSYFWEFGDGGVSSLENPLYTYNVPGTYTPSLTVTGPGGQATQINFDSVVVHDYSNAFFQNIPSNVFVPGAPVQFFNFSSNADRYLWDFGDGGIDSVPEPIHYYQNEGNYTVTLIANNANNCPDTLRVENAVIAKLGGEIQFPNAFTPDPNGPNGGVYDPNQFNNDVFFPIFEGVDDYQMQVFNRWGELIFETTDINIGWDGYYRGKLVQSDVYIWKARARFTNGDEITKVGQLHLIR